MKKKRLLTAACSIVLAAATVGVFTPKILGSLNSMDTVQAGADTAAEVKLSVSEAQAKPGDAFKLNLNISGVPSSGVNCCELAIQFNTNVVTDVKATKGDVLSALDTNELNVANGTINLGYASIDGAIKKDGTVLVIEGKVSATAKAGDKSNFKVVPINRPVTPGSSTKVGSVYVGFVGDDNVVSEYKATCIDGLVSVVGDDAEITTTKATETTQATESSSKDETTKVTESSSKDETTKESTTKASTTKKPPATTTTKATVSTHETTVGEHPLGDVTLDGKVSVADIVYLQNHLVNNLKFNDEQSQLADLNGDKKINVFDAVALRRMLLKK